MINPKMDGSPSTSLPLGIAYVASSLEKAGHNVNVIDASILSIDNERVVKEILNRDSDIVGITANIGNFLNVKEICYLLKDNKFSGKVIIGGPLSIIYSKLLEFSDFVIIGEGEQTTVNLLNAIMKKTSFKSVSGIAFKKNDKIIVIPPKYIQDLDELPFPAWHLFPPLKKYRHFGKKRPCAPIITSRGCPFNCIYCTKHIHGHKFRARSPENVVKEIEFLIKNYNIKELAIIDDNFILDKVRVEKICDAMIEKDFNIQWSLLNGVRTENVTKKLLEKMRTARCYCIAIGAETGNQEIANKIQRNQNLNDIRRAAKLIKDEGFVLKAFFQIGLPYDTLKTMRQTIEFAKELDPDFAQFSITTPFPGTKLYELAKDKGIFLHDIYNFNTYFEGKASYEIFGLKANDVERMYKIAYREFYNFNKIFSLIKNIKTWVEFRYCLNTGFLIFRSLI